MQSFVPALFVLAVMLGFMLIPAAALVVRRKRIRALRRSPLTTDLLRPPGHQLRDEIERVRDDVDLYVTFSALIPLLAVCIHLAQSYLGDAPESALRIGFTTATCVISIIYCVRRLQKLHLKLDHLRMGYDAELAVGQELDQLMRQGAAVFHDFPADKFNIDHIVISPVGVFAVETKGRAKRLLAKGQRAEVLYEGGTLKFPGWTETLAPQQAVNQAKWLADWLTRAVGEPVTVKAVLAIPGWFVTNKGRGKLAVYSGRALDGLLRNDGFTTLTPDAMQRVIHAVEQRCRDLAPTFNRAPDGSERAARNRFPD